MNIPRAMAASLIAACLLTPPAHGQGLLGAGVVDSQVDPKGAFVSTVEPGSPAAAAGVVPGDVITGADGAPIGGVAQLQQILAAHHAGEALHLRVVHYGSGPADITVTLGGAAPAAAQTATGPSATPTAAPTAAPVAGKHARADLTWTRYADPAEHAFTIDVPAGWRISGGTRRMSAVDIRLGVEAVSPDGLITLFYGDPDVPIFTVPSEMLEMGGCIPA